MASESVKKRFLDNSGWMMGQQVYYMLLSLVVGSLSARYLGPSNYGLINYGASIITLFSIVCKLGLDGVIINEMIKAPQKRGAYLGTALLLRFLASLLSLGCIVGIVRILEPQDRALHLITLLQAFAIILQSLEVFQYWFQLNLRMKYVSIATMVGQTVVAAWRVLLLIRQASVYLFALSASILALVTGGIVTYFFFADRERPTPLRFSSSDGFALLKKSYHFIISAVAITFYMQIDKVMIGKIIDHQAVGIYTAATTIASLWEFVPHALINSARPLIIQQRESDYASYLKRFRQLLLGITVLSVIVGIGITLLGFVAVRILYGEEYMGAVAPLSILIWSTGFAMIGTARTIWLVAENYHKYSKHLVLIGAATNFLLNLIAIPRWGILGASVTTLISQITVALISPLFFREIRVFDRIYVSSFREIHALPELLRRQR